MDPSDEWRRRARRGRRLVRSLRTRQAGRGNRGIYAVLETRDNALYRITEETARWSMPASGLERRRLSGRMRGAVLALADGSRVEMRSQSELSLERADDGVRIRLRTGSIIVNAAKQPSGHLYVQTKDVTVSVVGTMFLVNAETDGSRVAVIEGEVRVQRRRPCSRRRRDEAAARRTGRDESGTGGARPVKEEIAWSRHADAHLAILAALKRAWPYRRSADDRWRRRPVPARRRRPAPWQPSRNSKRPRSGRAIQTTCLRRRLARAAAA